jgi:hypothetical protein
MPVAGRKSYMLSYQYLAPVCNTTAEVPENYRGKKFKWFSRWKFRTAPARGAIPISGYLLALGWNIE